MAIFLVDENVIQVRGQSFSLWFYTESVYKFVIAIYISEDRNMLVLEKFIRSVTQRYTKHFAYADRDTWYDETCNVLGLKHSLPSSFEKSLKRSELVFQG